jgi:hypothetical protein
MEFHLRADQRLLEDRGLRAVMGLQRDEVIYE